MHTMDDTGARLGQLLRSMVRQAGELRLQQTASSLTLLTLLAIVPMAAVGLLVLTALPAFAEMRVAVQQFVADNLFLPSFSETVSAYINEFAAAADKLSAIGTIAFFASAMMAMLTIDETLNDIWRTPRPRPLAQRLALYWSMLTLGPLLLGAALALQVRVAAQLPGEYGGVEVLARLLPPLLAAGGITLLYRLAPNERVRWRHAFAGALVTTLLLEGLRRLLGLYIAHFPSYTVVYGAFAALPLFLLWLFSIWMSVLLGALVAANLRFWAVPLGAPHVATPAAEFERVVRVLGEIVRAAPHRVPAARFRPDFDGDARAADRVAGLLAVHGYIVRVWPVARHGGPGGVWDEYWLPSPQLGSKSLRPVFDRIWVGEAARRQRRVGPARAAPLDPGGPALSRPLEQLLGGSAGPTQASPTAPEPGALGPAAAAGPPEP
jgi:membrane protein